MSAPKQLLMPFMRSMGRAVLGVTGGGGITPSVVSASGVSRFLVRSDMQCLA